MTGGDLHCPQDQGGGAGVPTEQLHRDSRHPGALLTTYGHSLGEVATAAEENKPVLRRGAGTGRSGQVHKRRECGEMERSRGHRFLFYTVESMVQSCLTD